LSEVNSELRFGEVETTPDKPKSYVQRLSSVAARAYHKGEVIEGRIVENPSALVYGWFKKAKERPLAETHTFVTYLPIKEEKVVLYPYYTIATSKSKSPVINPDMDNCFTVARVPNTYTGDMASLAELEVEQFFTFSQNNVVTVDGLAGMTSQQKEWLEGTLQLFESVVEAPKLFPHDFPTAYELRTS
jgi:hypothetical protein